MESPFCTAALSGCAGERRVLRQATAFASGQEDVLHPVFALAVRQVNSVAPNQVLAA